MEPAQYFVAALPDDLKERFFYANTTPPYQVDPGEVQESIEFEIASFKHPFSEEYAEIMNKYVKNNGTKKVGDGRFSMRRNTIARFRDLIWRLPGEIEEKRILFNCAICGFVNPIHNKSDLIWALTDEYRCGKCLWEAEADGTYDKKWHTTVDVGYYFNDSCPFSVYVFKKCDASRLLLRGLRYNHQTGNYEPEV